MSENVWKIMSEINESNEEGALVEKKREEWEDFDTTEIPEFYDLAESVNQHLINMAKGGAIKIGERGRLRGKVRFDQKKFYKYWRKLEEEDPVSGYIIKNVFDDWRDLNYATSSWIKINRLFGLGDAPTNVFTDRDCVKRYNELEKEAKDYWNKNFDIEYHKMRDIENQTKKEVEIYDPILEGDGVEKFKEERMDFYYDYLDNVDDGRVRRSILNSVEKGWSMNANARAEYNKMRKAFVKKYYQKYIKDEYHDYYDDGMNSLSDIKKKVVEEKLSNNQKYQELHELSEDYQEKYDNFKDLARDLRFSGECSEQFDVMKKEIRDFSDWVSDEILLNFSRK